jgi:hypothetical protein
MDSTYCMMYDTADGIVYEDYMVIEDLYRGWVKVMLTQVTFAEDCECEEDSCEHRVTCNEIGALHPGLVGRPVIGSTFSARRLSDLVEDGVGRYKCIKIWYGKGMTGVATQVV